MNTIRSFYHVDWLNMHVQWRMWLRTWEEGGDMGKADAELLVRTLNSYSRHTSPTSEELLAQPQYQQLLDVTTRVCSCLRLFQNLKVRNRTYNCL